MYGMCDEGFDLSHNGLKPLYEDDSAESVPAAMADKRRKLLLALETADNIDQASRFPG